VTAEAGPGLSVLDAGAVSGATVLGVSGSMKPATGDGRSAARSLLVHTLETLASVYEDVALLDLAVHPLPHFDGRFASERDDANLELAVACAERCGAFLLSVPAYWAGVSGVFKNFVDVLCGPAYDLPPGAGTPFSEKPTGVVVVGADEESAVAGAEQAQRILASVGARLVADPVVVANPREAPDTLVTAAREAVAVAALTASELRRRSGAGAVT
jgi:NAD(P)H-dependent FMN reductase